PLPSPLFPYTTLFRSFLKRAGGSALATLTLGLPSGWAGTAYADDSPETRTIRLGIIALTDCSPIVMAHELGYFKQFGIESIISRSEEHTSNSSHEWIS